MNKEKIVFIIKRNLKYWKKSWLKTSLLMMVIAFLMLIIGMLGNSLLDYFDEVQSQSPKDRSIIVSSNASDSQSVFKLLEKYANDDDKIEKVHYDNPSIGAHVNNALELLNIDVPKEKRRFGDIGLCSDFYTNEKYLVSGRWIKPNETNVMLVPVNMSFNSITEDVIRLDIDRVKGESLIGKVVEVSYFSYQDQDGKLVPKNEYKKKFTVIGTYDNVRITNDESDVIIPDDDISEIKKSIDDDMNNKIAYNYRVLVKDGHLNESVMKELRVILKDYEVGVRPVIRVGGFLGILGPLMQTVMLASIFIFLIGFLLQKALIKRLIHQRSDELGTLKVMGYSDNQVIKCFIAEILVFSTITFIGTIFLSFLFKEGFQFWIRNYTGYMFSSMPIVFKVKDILFAFMMLVIIPLISGIFNLKTLKSIQPIDAISGVVE